MNTVWELGTRWHSMETCRPLRSQEGTQYDQYPKLSNGAIAIVLTVMQVVWCPKRQIPKFLFWLKLRLLLTLGMILDLIHPVVWYLIVWFKYNNEIRRRYVCLVCAISNIELDKKLKCTFIVFAVMIELLQLNYFTRV